MEPKRFSITLSQETAKRLSDLNKKELAVTKSEIIRRALVIGLKQLEAGAS